MADLTLLEIIAGQLLILGSFTISASAGMGGSLLLVPTMSLLLGVKEGVAVAALLLGANNVAKVAAYRATIPWLAASGVVVATIVGAFIGARLLAGAPEGLVAAAVVASLGASFLAEHGVPAAARRASAPLLALAAGATSGFSGSSGPLKGIALRALGLDRLHLVGAASLVSLVNDLTKAGVFVEAGLITTSTAALILPALPLTLLGTWAGRRINIAISERLFAAYFWSVMAGYALRLALR